MDEEEEQLWHVFQSDEAIVAVPIPDLQPHTTKKVRKNGSYDLAGFDCPCTPRIESGDEDGMYEKPVIFHQSFLIKDIARRNTDKNLRTEI